MTHGEQFGGSAMPEARFRRGDRVEFEFVTRTVFGEVKEDRGPIGINPDISPVLIGVEWRGG